MKKCKIKDCEGKHMGKGLCSSHYYLKYRKDKKKGTVRPFYEPVPFETTYKIWKESKHLGRKILAQFAMAYLTGARVSEIIGLRKQDITYTQSSKGDEIMLIKMPTLKNRRIMSRELPIPIKDPRYKEMVSKITGLINSLNDYERVFPISRITMDRHFKLFPNFTTMAIIPSKPKKKIFNNIKIIEEDENHPTRKTIERTWFPHYCRHCRLTDLVKIHKSSPFELMYWAGWSDIKLANKYVHYNWDDLAKMITSGKVNQNY